jgi:hypothetical protein
MELEGGIAHFMLLSAGFEDTNSPFSRLPIDLLPIILDCLQLMFIDFCEIIEDETYNNDMSVFTTDSDTLEKYAAFRGDAFLFSHFNFCRSSPKVVLIAITADPATVRNKNMPGRFLSMNVKQILLPKLLADVLRRRMRITGPIFAAKAQLTFDIGYGKQLLLSYANEDAEKFTQNRVFADHVVPFFADAYRPSVEGDVYCLGGLDITVAKWVPNPCFVSPETILLIYSAEECVKVVAMEDMWKDL